MGGNHAVVVDPGDFVGDRRGELAGLDLALDIVG